jgi:hypothetical protein
MFLRMDGALDAILTLLMSNDEVISSLSVVILKALRVFDIPRINSVIPPSKSHLMEMEDDIPRRVGEEYGGKIL